MPSCRIPASMIIAVTVGYCAGRFVYSMGMASAVWFLTLSCVCPAVLCLMFRSWRVVLGLLVNSAMAVTVAAQSYGLYHRMNGSGIWWRDFSSSAAIEVVLVLLSLAITIPLSLTKRTT